MKQISYYFSVLSPYSYLAGMRLEEIASSHRAAISYRPLDIFHMFSQTGGIPPKDRHPSRQRYRLMDLERTARTNGLPLNIAPKHWPTDPVPASLAIIAATGQGGDQGRLVHEIMACCWARDLDIAQPDVIDECLKTAGYGISSTPADPSTAERIFHENTVTAITTGVFGSPTYVLDDQLFWGQDRLDQLKAILEGMFCE